MTVREILSLAEARGVKLRVEGQDLAFRAPKGAVTPELRAALAAHKADLVAFFTGSGADEAAAAKPIPRTTVVEGEPGPLSAGQARLWFLDRLAPGSAQYNVHFGLHLRGSLDREALRASLESTVARHAMLRAIFVEHDGRPSQIILPPQPWELPVVDLRHTADRDAALARLTAEQAAAPFDLERGPLLRTTLVALDTDEHVVLVTQHHIVTDASSLSVMGRDLLGNYQAITSGRAPALAEPGPIRFVDFVRWQEAELAGDEARRSEDWWRHTLADLPRLELPVAHNPAGGATHAGDTVSLTLPPELAGSLKELARREGTTLFVVLLSVWATLLHRTSRQVDFGVGTVTSGRGRSELDGLVGFFVNTLVLRCDLSGDPDMTTLIARLRDTVTGALAHQDLPFDRVVNAVASPRGPDLNPLFRAAFGLESVPLPTGTLPGLDWTQVTQRADGGVDGTTKFDVGLTIVEQNRGLWCTIEYATDLFDREVIERMAGHFALLAQGLVAAPGRRVSELPILTEAERHRVVVTWNAKTLELPRACIHELFEAQVDRSPQAIAVSAGAASLTYAELDRRANQLAHHLRGMGVGRETLVAICVERGLSMVVAMLAVLKSGGGYVPLDPDYPRGRLEHMLADSRATVLLTEDRLAGTLAAGSARVVRLDTDGPDIASWPAQRPAPLAAPDNVAYCIYTSGSTGKPKGVVLEHKNAVAFIAWAQETFSVVDTARVLFATSICFDLSIFELFAPLASGGQVIVVRNALALLEGPIEPVPTLINTVPSAAQALLDARALPAGLRVLNLAGEPLRRELAEGLLAAAPDLRLHNLYGPTESTTYSTYSVVRAGERVTIGRPLAGTQIYLLDGRREPVPIGIAGEVYIAGAGVARGYHDRPELTAERFVPDPFGPPGGRMYRTGDLARFLSDGSIDFLGRIDLQVKIRGFRIELGEIESALLRCPGVAAALVMAREDVPGDRRLVAYLVADATRPPDATVAAGLAESLPEYMLPSALVWLDAFPLTPSGKIDRKGLPQPADSRPSGEYVAPQTPTQIAVAEIFAEVLGIERAGRDESFFALGGHSLLATQVTSRVRAVLGVPLPLRAVFEAPTVATLARRIDKALGSEAFASRAPLGREERPDELPLSFAQQRLWFFDRLEPESSLYNVPAAGRLRGALDVARLERSLRTIVDRHEALRTVFPASAGRPRQEIALDPAFELPIVRVSDEADLGRRLRAEAHRPFDLARGPVVRAILYRLADDDHALLVNMHHTVTDGWSLGVLVRELGQLYRGDELPELPIQYADFTLWQRRWLASDAAPAELAYWKRQLAGAPPVLELPTDRPHPPQQSYRGAAVALEMSAELTRALRALVRREGTTMFVALLAAWQTLLGRYSGQDDIVVGTPIAGRTEAATEPLIGLFVNTLALRTDLSGDPTVRELFGRVRETTLDAHAHQELPFEKVLDHLVPDRQLSRSRLFQVLFVLQNAPLPRTHLGECVMDPIFIEPETAKFDLMLSMQETDGRLAGYIEYATELYERSTIERMAGHLGRLLESFVATPEAKIAELPILTPAERAQLAPAVEPARAAADARCLHELFEAAASQHPDAVAVACGAERVVYRELDERANRLAHHLRALGVGAEVRVALLFERSLDMVVAILGVLKAGGSYVPLDPAHPAERLAFMIGDTAAPIVVTEDRLSGRVPPHPGHTVRMDADWSVIAAHPATAPATVARAEDCAYIIYTSGSTGVPKGVMVTHANVVRLLTATEPWFHFDDRDVWTLFHSYAFDFSVWEMWGALAYGGRLVVVPYDVSRSPAAFRELLAREQVTVLNQTPSAFRLLVSADADSASPLALRLVIFGGEAVDLPSLGPWFARHGDERPALVNMYGITETTVHVTYRRLSARDVAPGGSPSPIGVPIPDLSVRILDRSGQIVPIGVPGEIVVGGAGVARGYLDRLELTAARFIADPFAPGGRLYRSGDRGRVLADGTLEYLGRLDDQVKIRGFRIELGEIEAALGQHPGVREAVVTARNVNDDDEGVKRLVAYVVARDASAPTLGELRAHLKDRLPEHMIPAVFVSLDALPLTGNGKVDRKALPAPERSRPELLRPYQAARSPIEERLAQIWADVLKLERVGIDDRFFELGGDSILSIQVVARAHAAGLEMSVRALFQHQTIRELAEALAGSAARAVDATSSVEAFALIDAEDRARLPDGVEDAYPLAMLQTGMIYHSENVPDLAVYHDITSFHAEYVFEEERLRQALERMAAAHPILRTSFDFTRYGEPLQLVHRSVVIPLVVDDWRALAHDEQESALTLLLEADKRRGFDLGSAPLCRVYLQRRTERSTQVTLVNHHAILDGWSVAALVTELVQSLVGAAPGQPPTSRYSEFVALERRALASDETRRFWAQWTEGAPLAALPHGEASSPGPARRLVDVALGSATSRALEDLARAAGVPVKSVLLAAHLRAMSVWSGEVDVVTGLVANGRPESKDAERALGLYLNTVPFRQRLRPGSSWLELARETFATERSLLAHRHHPLAEIQRLHGGPLFDAAFNFIHFHVFEELGAAGIGRVLGMRSYELTNFRFVANFSRDLADGDLRLSLSVSAPELTDAQVEDIRGLYARTLAAMAQNPSADALAEGIYPADERRRILEDWNATGRSPMVARCVHELVEEQARARPDAVAVVHGERHLSYSELDARADRLAARLRSLGVGRDARVAVFLERSAEAIVALYGVLKAGGAYVPLEPAHPGERLAFLLGDSGASVVISERSLIDRLPGERPPIVLVDQVEGADGARSAPSARDLAYVIYTSGSTGTPKGVLVEHENLVALIDWTHAHFGLTASSRTTQLASLGFDAATWEIWPTLAAGAALHIVDDETRTAPERLVDWLAGHAITNTFLPTPLAEAVLAVPWPAETALRTLATGGDRLHRRPPAGLPFRLVNMYGPTETTVIATTGDVTPDGSGDPAIGRPIAGTRVYVLDGNRQPVPVGVAGELFIGGAGVARGYLERPELTAERFVADPFAALDPDARMYRSGDRVRWQPDGSLAYLGRIDAQVKIRGHRIELGEIESVLLLHPAVAEAAVVARGTSQAGKRLVAYVTVRGSRPAATELRDFLKAKLPEHMVPAVFVTLAAMPQNASGKIDRKALPAPDVQGDAVASAAPRTQIEDLLAGLWAEVLHIDRVGTDDDFFALGGHSLVATRVMSRIRAVLGVELPLRALFEAPTVAALARRVEVARAAGETAAAPPLVRCPRPEELPLSFAQQRLWFLDRLEPGSTAYNVPLAVRLRGPLDVAALRRSLCEIVCRHEVLRTAFPMRDGQPRQLIADHLDLEVPILAADDEDDVNARAAEEAGRPFDLAHGPLLRALLMKRAADEHVLLITFHHIVADGWSIGVLVDELAALYRGERLPELDAQVADHALWQRRWLAGDVLARELAYWKQTLDGAAPALELPTDHPRPAVASSRGGSVPISIAPEVTRGLVALGRREGATLFMTLLAGWQALLQRYTGQDDILVGTPIAGRTEAETERLIGLFVNTLVLRTDLSGQPTVREVLERVKATTLSAYAHQALPFEKLIEGLAPPRDLGRSPLFQTLLILQNTPPMRLALGDVVLEPLPTAATTAKFELTLSVQEVGGRLEGALEYMTDLYDRSTIERMVGHLTALLAAMALEPGRAIADLPILSAAEQHELLVEWNDNATPVPAACIHELVQAQAARTPDATAVTFAGAALSYAELDRRANQLAHHLQSLGIGPESRVAVCLDRGLPLVVALLGVLKAGGAYVPLDPAYPRARLQHMLEDSGATVLLTTAGAADALPTRGVRTAFVDADAPAIAALPTHPPARSAHPDDLAYCIYTSGSTGKPKGVALTHANAVAFLTWALGVFDREDTARVLFSTSICFDLSIFELFVPLSAGGTVVLVENALTLVDAPVVSPPTLINTVPSAAQALLAAGALPSSLRVVNLAGEPLRRELADGLAAALPEARIYNLYGPTEYTTYSTFCQVHPGEPIVIGRPLPNTQIYLLDRHRRAPVPRGVVGEIYIGGAGLARGYLGRPDLTAERFVDNPFRAGRVYRTGDLGRYLADGSIEFLGRIDHQVKVRGHRIELGEIEEALARAGVRDSVVVAREDAPGERRLVAYLVGTGVEDRPGARELEARLGATLPAFMIPSDFVWLAALPLTPNGKIDRKALPAPERKHDDGDDVQAPRDATELELVRIWEELLNVRPVGTRADFFTLGGHSLAAVTLLKRVEDHFGLPVSLSSFFQRPTIEGLAAGLRERTPARPWSPLVKLQSRGRGRPFFAVHPGLGSIARYQGLARSLGDSRPFHALTAIGLERGQTPDTRVEEMAKRYLEAVRRVQPKGPYLLGGHSFGGLVAFEMASALVADGERVDLLALLDTTAPGPAWSGPQAENEGLAALALYREAELDVDDAAFLGLDPEAQVSRYLGDMTRAGHLPLGTDLEQVRRMVTWRTRIVPAAYRAYVPRSYAGTITLVRASERPSWPGLASEDGFDPFVGWSALSERPIIIKRVPGDHFSMLRPPHVQALAHVLGRELERRDRDDDQEAAMMV